MNRRPSLPWWVEVPLVGVSVTVVVGFARVYESWAFLAPLLAFALGAHALAIATRRLRVPAPVTIALAVVGAAVAVAWILFPDTTAFGLPTPATWEAASHALDVARLRYPHVIAPSPVLPGFQLAAGLALWVAAWFADWSAHRLRATAEALASTTAIFVFCSILGSGRYQLACAALFATAALVFVGVERSVAIRRDQPWLPTNAVTARALLRSAAAVAAVAVLAGVIVGPRLPGADSDAALSWRNGDSTDQSRTTISPLVDLRKRLVQQSNREVFRVRSDARAYWRLTSLDAFDGQIWSSSGDYTKAGEQLPSEAPRQGGGRVITQRITIEALSAIWAPSAFEAVGVRDTDAKLRWDRGSSTLIVDASSTTSDGLTYTVESRAPNLDPAELRAAKSPDPTAITQRYTGLPDDFPFLAGRLARTATVGATTRYAKALALQNWFRTNFDYSLDIAAGHSDHALESFLKTRRGYCEQFAGSYAAMARFLGIPARVAVGFTPGNADKDDPTLYRVLGRHAHAWPEVYFPHVGWVAFEPTPGRGMPGAESYTGVREQQDNARPVVTVTTTIPVSTTVDRSEGKRSQPPRSQAEQARTTASGSSQPADDAWSPLQVLAALAVVASVAAAIVTRRRRRREAQRRAALSRADRRWEEVLAVLARRRGIAPDRAETQLEFAHRAAPELNDAGAPLVELAEMVTQSRWSPDGLDEAGEEALTAVADQVLAALDAKVPVA